MILGGGAFAGINVANDFTIFDGFTYFYVDASDFSGLSGDWINLIVYGGLEPTGYFIEVADDSFISANGYTFRVDYNRDWGDGSHALALQVVPVGAAGLLMALLLLLSSVGLPKMTRLMQHK